MSLLIFEHYPEQVMVITDTLATTKDGTPLAFWDKCFMYPHLRMIMVTTGVFGIADKWNRYLNGVLVAKDIDMVDKYATKILQEIYRQLKQEFGDLPSTSTVYHFGWSEESQQYIRYVYRSEGDFVSESYIDASFGVKPQPKDTKIAIPVSLEEMIEYAKKIRKEQSELEKNKRVYFGGELIITILNNEGIITKSIHTFDDSESDWLTMNQAL